MNPSVTHSLPVPSRRRPARGNGNTGLGRLLVLGLDILAVNYGVLCNDIQLSFLFILHGSSVITAGGHVCRWRKRGVQQSGFPLLLGRTRGPPTQACHGMFTFYWQGHAIGPLKAEPTVGKAAG